MELTDSSEASTPFQGLHPTQPTFPRRACKYVIVYLDVYSVLDDPLLVVSMEVVVEMAAESGVQLAQHERPNVDVFAGNDSSGDALVVFVDRFEDVAFHSEPGYRRFAWLYRDWL